MERSRLLLALAAAVVVASVATTARTGREMPTEGRDGGRLEAAANEAGASERQLTKAPERPAPTSGSARPSVLRSLRNLPRVSPVWHGNRNLEAENEAGKEEAEQGEPPLKRSLRLDLTGDGAVQRSAPTGLMPPSFLSFDGVENVNGVLPPDTNGDIGPNHYMQWVNLSFQIFNRSGIALGPPRPGNSLFTGKPVCGLPANNDGDPIVLYDQFAGRWLASHFALPGGSPDPEVWFGPFYQCIAVSTSSDPTAGWCQYEFQVHPTKMNDYPHFGVWPTQNGYFMTVNQFDQGSMDWGGGGVYAFERDKMLACEPAQFVYQDLYDVRSDLGGMLPADADGTNPPPPGAPNPVLMFDDDSDGYPQDQLEVWNASVDWTAPSISFAHESNLQTAPFTWNICGIDVAQCIPQPSTTIKLHALADRLMHRVQYRNLGTRQTLVVNHTVNAGSGRAGVRWYELSKTTGDWAIRQQSTFAPDDSLHRWMGSAAMDASGDIAVGYSAASSSTFPGLRYAGRLVGDPFDNLSQGEATLVVGTGSQTHPEGRWGDYSMLSVDPTDECTFWLTSEYIESTGRSPWKTQIGSFRFPSCVTPVAPASTTAPTVTGGPEPGQTLATSNGTWSGTTAMGFTYTWLRDGAPITGESGATYVIRAADSNRGIAVRVTAANAAGSASARSNVVAVPAPPPPPPPAPPPAPLPAPPPVLPPALPQPAPHPPPRPAPPPAAKKKAPLKVVLCHKGRTIRVLKSQVQKHRRHGDKLGACRTKRR